MGDFNVKTGSILNEFPKNIGQLGKRIIDSFREHLLDMYKNEKSNRLCVMLCTILYNLETRQNTHEVVTSACSFTKRNTPLWMFCTFLKLYK